MNGINDIAACFINKEPLTNKKLQKLAYYTVAWGWALFNQAIVEDSQFEAWVHGPVSPTLYEVYREFGWIPIKTPVVGDSQRLDTSVTELLASVWETYGDKTGDELEALTHSELPWQQARLGLSPNEPSHHRIATTTMHDFYLSIYSGA